jgi:hypothetical protein
MNWSDIELFEAAIENNVPEVCRLLSVGADVNAKNRFGWTPLHWTCCNGHSQAVQALLEHGADIEAKHNGGGTPLHFACSDGHLPVVNELLSPNESNSTTNTILGKRKSRGADIDATDNKGDTPLHHASCNGHFPVVKALWAAGADILAVNDYGELAIHRAVIDEHSEVAKYLLQQMYATTCRLPLHELLEDFSWIGDPSSDTLDVRPLREALADNVLSTDDVVDILEYLVDRDPTWLSARDQDGSLPLHVACRLGVSFSFVQPLVNLYKASVKSVTPGGDLPLFLACEIPEPSLDTIFTLMKLYPDFVYR